MYDEYLASGQPPLSVRTALELYSLFLQGYSTAEIAKTYPTLGHGIIVRARVDYCWDEHKAAYITHLMASAQDTMLKTQLEAVRFATDGMAVYHKMVGDRFKRYLRSGNDSDLGDFKEMSFRTYRDMVALALQLTGQDDKKKVTTAVGGEITHRHELVPSEPEKALDVGDVSGKSLLDFLEKSGGIK